MKNKIFFLSIFVLIIYSSGIQKSWAQIEDIYYPHPNYMNCYLPDSLREIEYNLSLLSMRTNNTDTDYALNSTFTEVFAYNVALPIRVDSCMIYGIAACLTHKTWSFGLDWSLAPYYSGFGYDVDLKAYLFEATEGDSLVRLVKKQNFSIKKGQYPDKMLHLSDTGGMRAPVYEFYFDTPVMVRGSILVGLHPTNDEKKFYEININLDRQGFCSPGYIAVIKNDSIFFILECRLS